MESLDFSALTDDQLITLIRSALQEAIRRSPACEAAARSATLDEAEKAKITRDAAEREARRLKEEEAHRVASEAAERVRRDAEEAKAQAQRDQAAKIRGLAVQARELFGSDQAEFSASIWEKNGDRRVYVGHGYDGNWVEYYHTGNSRFAPGTIKFPVPAVAKDLATHLGITEEEAKAKIKDFCASLCNGWKSLKLEVTPDNAPPDPACKILEGWVVWDGDRKNPWYLRKSGGCGKATVTERAVFPTREAAAEAATSAGLEAKYQPAEIFRRLAFAPKPATSTEAK